MHFFKTWVDMKLIVTITTFLLTLCGLSHGEEFPVQDVLDMALRDMEVRQRWMQQKRVEVGKELRFQEIGNSAFLREILNTHGLPKKYENPELESSILQLVLHSSDLEFQEEVLATLKPLHGGNMIAALTDRVLLRKGEKQKYGTHLYHENGQLVPYPIQDQESINEVRREIGEPPIEKYLEIMNTCDRAFQGEEIQTLYKILFNMRYHFQENPNDYLYFATCSPNEGPQKDDGALLAFEDPSLATAFALLLTTPVNGDISFEGKNLLVTLSPQKVDDTLILGETPIYITLVKKSDFVLHEQYGPEFLDRVYRAEQSVQPVTQFECDSPLETLILSGAKIKILGTTKDYEYQDTSLWKKMYSMLYFDITMENEPFKEM